MVVVVARGLDFCPPAVVASVVEVPSAAAVPPASVEVVDVLVRASRSDDPDPHAPIRPTSMTRARPTRRDGRTIYSNLRAETTSSRAARRAGPMEASTAPRMPTTATIGSDVH